VLVLAIVIPALVVLKAPEPPPSGYSLSEAVTALRTGEVKLQNGHLLKAITTTTAPDFINAEETHGQRLLNFQTTISQRLAAELNVPADTIVVRFPPRKPFNGGPRGYNAVRMMGDGNFGGSNFGPPDNGGPRMYTQRDGGPGPFGDMPPPGDNNSQSSAFSAPVGGNAFGAERADTFYPAFNAAWKLKDGTWRVITPPKVLIEPWQARLLLGFGLTALLILPLAWWLSQRLSRPIIAFSEAAAKLSVEENAPPVLSVGPREVRAAADVLNEMQTRIRKQVESRTALMGAIAHDLKTPLARMRLRIEDLPGPLREKLSGDIAHMDGLIRSAMSFTSAHKMNETLRPLDLSSLVESLCDDLSAICTMETALVEDNIMVKGDGVALKRIITNLVENAGRYAGGCRIELSSRGDKAELRIIDDGPGLPLEALETVFEPFYRLESSRNRDTGGTGLGLSVARALTEAQGGSLTAANRYAGKQVIGLELLLVMPTLSLK
jgi:signal transduction histidine kinase